MEDNKRLIHTFKYGNKEIPMYYNSEEVKDRLIETTKIVELFLDYLEKKNIVFSDKQKNLIMAEEDGKPFTLTLNDDIQKVFKEMKKSYLKCHDFNDKLAYKNNMIKTTISDIDIEEKGNTSYIESLAAVCCKKIKNKNQRTALNLLKILDSNLLNESKILKDDYVIAIWRALTDGNRNAVSIEKGYRVLPVKLAKGGVLGLKKDIVYIAPKAKDVPIMINNLYKFVNSEPLV